MKVYGYPQSTCTRKVLMTLNEKAAPFQFELVDLRKEEQKNTAYLLHQPFGVVPVLEDEGFKLYESRAILRYLDKRLPGVALIPGDLQVAARMEQWMEVESAYFSGPAIQLVKQLFWGKLRGEEPDINVVARARERVQYALDIIERVLFQQAYLAGDQFSLADICWMPYIDYLFPATLGQLVTERPGVNRWWTQVSQRRAWLEVIEYIN